jgi:hypothetical protein
MCWGWNWFGQLGTGSADDKYSPLAVNLGSGRSSKGGKEGGKERRREGGREGGRKRGRKGGGHGFIFYVCQAEGLS